MPARRPLTWRQQEILRQEEYCACFIVPVLFWLLASLTITMGYYGTKSMVLGPNFSHLITANPLFVSHVEAKADHRVGPTLYSFSGQPVLGSHSLWNESHSLTIEPDNHQELRMWLNKGSKLHITCFILSSGFYSIFVTVSEGHSGLQEWLKHRTGSRTAAVWKDIEGDTGSLEYDVTRDGDYFVAIGNLNHQLVMVELVLEVDATIYNQEPFDSKCSFEEGSCKVKFPLFGKRYGLLATPAAQNGSLNWEVELIYGARWISFYSALAGILIAVFIMLKIVKRVSINIIEQTTVEEVRSPLLSPRSVAAYADLVASDSQKSETCVDESVYDAKLCAVCLDAPKAVFFIPCGHCVTCLPCGQRIRHGDKGACPICRMQIEKIRRVFQA